MSESVQTSAAQERVSMYQCPADFVSFSYDSSGNGLWDGDEQKELWLIKAPARFDPTSFENLKLPTSGLKMVQSCGTAPQIYSVFGSRTAPSDLHLLVSKGTKRKPSLCSSSFSGLLKISESYGNCSENQEPVPVPSTPAPCIPAGLKQRFQPFGSSIAAHMQDEVTVVSPTTPKRTRPDPNEEGQKEDEERKKKKKKKKDKRQEDNEIVIKQEHTQVDCDPFESSELMEKELMEESRKKKKKIKKERESQSEDIVDEIRKSKTESVDLSYYYDTPGKSKKKKKKTSRHE